MDNLKFEKIENGWSITGDTYYWKDDIKAVGGRWQPITKSWFIENLTELNHIIGMKKTLFDIQNQRFTEQRRHSIYRK